MDRLIKLGQLCDYYGALLTERQRKLLSQYADENLSLAEIAELEGVSRQAVRDGKIVTANGSGYLEFARECLLALEADTPEQIAASYAFNKHGFYRE